MPITDIDALAAALEGGDVPAQVGFPSFAGCLINNAKTVFDQPELREAFLLIGRKHQRAPPSRWRQQRRQQLVRGWC
eukprot:scaffold6317_cov98-Phaeocystis_antarctica.AAC.2